mgnify:CR=1 FL=1
MNKLDSSISEGVFDMNKIFIQRKLKEQENFIKKIFHVTEIGIFGSFFKGEQKADSDIDILVEFKKGHKDFFNYMRLKHYLGEMFGKKVDLVIKNAIKAELREKILNEVEYA